MWICSYEKTIHQEPKKTLIKQLAKKGRNIEVNELTKSTQNAELGAIVANSLGNVKDKKEIF